MPPFEKPQGFPQQHHAILRRATRFDSVSENVFGLVALIVALVALGTTTLQVLHQYFASAEGYRRCHKSVMGLWAAGTKRKLRWFQFRMEVLFEVPCLFTCPPDNKSGPLKDRPILFVQGTVASYHDTMVEMPEAQEQALKDTTMKVHTADDERATWVTLLSSLQNAENLSRAWDKEQTGSCNTAPYYDLEVAVQQKTRSWDFLPPAVTKPYASSTICHLVEFMSMLGLHWKTFDQKDWNLRAEGNGFILTSTNVVGLGVMVVFERTGKPDFKDCRVIPCMAIKDLSFGLVTTLFNEPKYLKNNKDSQSLDLVFGSKEDVAETLETIGCSTETIQQYDKDHKHIFPASFEIIGMLGCVFRPRGSCFRMLPNPTADLWLKNAKSKSSWEMTRMTELFVEHIETSQTPLTQQFVEDMKIACAPLAELQGKTDSEITLDMRESIHDVLDKQTTYLQSVPQALVLEVVALHVTKITSLVSDASSPLNALTLVNKELTLMQTYFNDIRPEMHRSAEALSTASESELREDAQRDAIWLSLVLRMLCWLLLHDFEKSDRMIVPSTLRGSRMPIYIG